jgi:hypothetical protein
MRSKAMVEQGALPLQRRRSGMQRGPVLAMAVLLAACLLPAVVPAAETPPPGFDFRAYEARREQARTAVRSAQERYSALKARVLARTGGMGFMPRDMADPAQQALARDYLGAALALLQAALDYQYSANQTLPLALLPGGLQGWLNEWPANPFAGMRPLRVLRPADGFSPGDVVWELPPPEGYSLELGQLQPLAYQLYIYGASRDGGGGASGVAPLAENAGWARVPSGVVAASGHSAPPFRVKLAADQDAATLLEQARGDAWRRDTALEWAAERLQASDPVTQAWLLRGLDAQLRSARQVELLARALRAKPQSQWTETELNGYFSEALWLVYQGFNNATWAGGGGRQLDWGEWETQGLLPYWPANPLADWRPQRMLGPADGFSAGDMLLLRAPAYFADAGYGGTVAGSFEMCTYGATPGGSAPGLQAVDPRNIWAVRPPGIVAGYGVFAAPQAASEFNRAICHS